MEHFNVKIIPIIAILFIIGWCSMVVWAYKNSHKKMAEHKQHTEEVYGNIQFKGKVLKVHRIIDISDRLKGMMCIQLDYTNVDNFWKFDDMSCLKIYKNIATIPTNSLSNDAVKSNKRVNAILSATYIEVNMNNSKQMVFIDSLGNRYSQDLDYDSGGLTKGNLDLCDNCYY